MSSSWREALFGFRPVRWLVAASFYIRGRVRLAAGKRYLALEDFCWIVRVSGLEGMQRRARRFVDEAIAAAGASGKNPLIDAYRADPASQACARLYTWSGVGPHELFRDLIVLKQATASEKGVILLKYARTFSAVVALLDLEKLRERYLFVLEPCWAGYCDPGILMFIARDHPVLVQCFTEQDYQFIAGIGAPLVPLRLGPADWVNADIFKPAPAGTKQHDVVMVANWAAHKRHAQLFKALRDVRERRIKVLLIGFPWGGRTADDIRREAAAAGNPCVELDILEKVPHAAVAEYVSRCKAFVFLSRKEGDNKALVEAMFADVPAVVFDQTIGGASSRINPATGVLSSDAQLGRWIVHVLDHQEDYSPRAWALEHTGSAVATRVLDAALARVVAEQGGQYLVPIVEKINAPNLAYKDPAQRALFEPDYDYIRSCQRRT